MSMLQASRPTLSRRSTAALHNSRYPIIYATQRATFATTPANALPRGAESMFGGATGGSPSSYFQRSSLPANTVVKFVPQQTAWIVERMGRFSRILQPGLAILVPVIDRIAYVKSLKENAMEIPSQSAITADNVTLGIDGVLYTRVMDPYKASYGVEDADYAISQLAQTTMRSEIGQLTLDHVLKERAALNTNITQAINEAAADWGVRCLRYEIRDIHAPAPVVEAMHRQVTAERSKRAEILDSEGQRQSAINIAEGQKQSVILASEAIKAEQINAASGEAEAIELKANATARGIDAVAKSLAEGKQSAQGAVSLSVAEKYVEAFGKLAKEGTSVVVPGNVGDIGQMIATAMSVYGSVGQAQAKAQAQKLITGEDTSESKTRAQSQDKDSIQQSVLESFQRTQERH
ncbi:Putative Band 7 domain, Stomatin/HflK/HflC family, Band 7 extension, Band 7/SPFH domain superfamily [Septoria linicola]|uniref:Band 7 domain, Stomatin/HflK/HflC family, Band 7 extension, Band 7/SPFH domain superfamily n=1 Tax=Septoria linicola TaxID=215465 RepID=A0A9Q9AJW5_9PEZI|nr:putative Band 7 domain, Stomatin/HflK/HflC family, Band 7 extension, Band 7/SPFH domain superfamily [Septoria linicola]USW47503.1 Putative Band 7 domain, Stomatin/HflK/HflC family, Band 7 extension, Band 7/SPFH domain superfamily [Septoria linicola]